MLQLYCLPPPPRPTPSYIHVRIRPMHSLTHGISGERVVVSRDFSRHPFCLPFVGIIGELMQKGTDGGGGWHVKFAGLAPDPSGAVHTQVTGSLRTHVCRWLVIDTEGAARTLRTRSFFRQGATADCSI